MTDATHADIGFTVPMTGSYADYYSIIQSPCFAINVNADSFSVADLTYGPGWEANLVTYAGATGNVSEFGSFNAGFNGPQFGGNKPETEVNYLSFSLHNTGGTWDSADWVLTPNKWYVAVVHLAVDEGTYIGLTGFAGAVPPPPGAPGAWGCLSPGFGTFGLARMEEVQEEPGIAVVENSVA